MKFGEWFLALVLAIGIVLVVAEVSPTAINVLLVLILMGMVLSRWSEISKIIGTASRAADPAGAKR